MLLLESPKATATFARTICACKEVTLLTSTFHGTGLSTGPDITADAAFFAYRSESIRCLLASRSKPRVHSGNSVDVGSLSFSLTDGKKTIWTLRHSQTIQIYDLAGSLGETSDDERSSCPPEDWLIRTLREPFQSVLNIKIHIWSISPQGVFGMNRSV